MSSVPITADIDARITRAAGRVRALEGERAKILAAASGLPHPYRVELGLLLTPLSPREVEKASAMIELVRRGVAQVRSAAQSDPTLGSDTLWCSMLVIAASEEAAIAMARSTVLQLGCDPDSSDEDLRVWEFGTAHASDPVWASNDAGLRLLAAVSAIVALEALEQRA